MVYQMGQVRFEIPRVPTDLSLVSYFFATRASVARVLYTKNVFLGVLKNHVFR